MADQIELTRPGGGATGLQTVNPATGEPGKSYDPHSIDDAHAAAKAARAAFLEWRRTSFAERVARSFTKPPQSFARARTSSRA